MTTRTETIVWHKYPEEKPNKNGKMYLVNFQYETMISDGKIDFRFAISCNNWWEEWFYVDDGTLMPEEDVIAWANLPKGWK